MKLRERAMVALEEAEYRQFERTRQAIPKALKKYLGVTSDEIESWARIEDYFCAVVDGLKFTAFESNAVAGWHFFGELNLYLLWYCQTCGKFRERASVYSLDQLGRILSEPNCYGCRGE